jgi:phage/plasmid primase-like uncharacterized protein
MPPSHTKLIAVSRAAPCPVCGGNHKCSRSDDGLLLCGRRTGPQPGFVHLGAAKDEVWHLYRAADDPALLNRERNSPKVVISRPSVDWAENAEQLARNLTPALADELCEKLCLPRLALDALPMIGYDAASGAWTFPEQDGAGRIVGIVRRFRDGSKRTMPSSRRGLTVPANWYERDTPLFIVEGQSDTITLSLCAVSAIGRPSNTGGVDMLAELLSSFPLARQIVVMGENDHKPDGFWPGKDGAVRIASALSEKLTRPVYWTLPPAGAKDVRAWIISQKPDPCILDDWHILGESLWEF